MLGISITGSVFQNSFLAMARSKDSLAPVAVELAREALANVLAVRSITDSVLRDDIVASYL